jgi:outer membrane receptor protein involved in Fe transport
MSLLFRSLLLAATSIALFGFQDSIQGSISGSVYDSSNGQPVRGAAVGVKELPALSVSTDLDGKYMLKLPPGKYTVVVRAENYLVTEIGDVLVQAEANTETSTVLVSSTSVTKVDVVEKIGALAATEEAVLAERKLAASVSDSVSTEEIRKSIASDAAGVLERVTGVSVVDNQFVYVRGLGERYSATMLNSAMIPTTEPEKRVVPLDLFPAELIDNIRILKTYSPDLPGEFSGGLVQMTTVEFPSVNTLRVSASYGYNTATTRKPFLSYPGGDRDFFGFDGGSRGLPAAIPDGKRVFPGAFSQADTQAMGRAFSNNWEPVEISKMRPQQSYAMVGGGTFGRFGLVGALTFANRPQFQNELQRYIRQAGNRPFIFTNYEDFRSYTESARLGGVLNVAVRLTPANKLVFRNTLTRDTDKEAREFSGYDGGADTYLNSQRLRWVERGLLSSSVEGEHALARLGNSLFKWQLTYSSSTRDEPDMREVFRGRLDDGRYIFAAFSSSGLRFFNNLQDRIWEPQAEFVKPFFTGALTGLWKTGFRATLRNRGFQARRFYFAPINPSTLNLFLPSNQLFAPDNIRPNGFRLTEFTRATDRYDASMDIYAGYSMVDLGLGSKWRIVGGLRFEDADINVTTLDPLVPNAKPIAALLQNRDPVPGVNVIYSVTPRQNFRFSASRTLSRPDFRELSPFDFNNVLGGFVAQGNPNLLRATVTNFDARWEWFGARGQLFAVSYFEKRFKDPVEVTILPANDLRQTYVNAKGAHNRGIEIELRRNFAALARALRHFSVQSNMTLVDSDILIRDNDALLLTSKNRPLLGQSRFIFNALIDWARPSWRSSSRFTVNTVSRRLSDVGTFGLPDIFQERNVFLDFTYQFYVTENGKWTLRFNAENLGDNQYRWTQGDFLQRAFRLGRTYSAGLSYAIF